MPKKPFLFTATLYEVCGGSSGLNGQLAQAMAAVQ
jgi:hypothetical protein